MTQCEFITQFQSREEKKAVNSLKIKKLVTFFSFQYRGQIILIYSFLN